MPSSATGSPAPERPRGTTATSSGDLFAGTAWYYARYRPGYPAWLFELIVDRFGLDGTGVLLDLGCGTGQLALPLAGHVAEAIGVDPEPAMLAEAAATAERAGVRNVRWLLGSDRDLERLAGTLGEVRVTTIGRAFHWMDQDPTLRSLDRLTSAGGGVVIVGETERVWDGGGTWQPAVQAVIHRWLGPERRAGGGTRVFDHDPFEAVLARSPFSHIETLRRTFRRTASVDEIVGYLYSTSYCSAAVLGDRRAAFEADARATLTSLSPDEELSEEVTVKVWIGLRP